MSQKTNKQTKYPNKQNKNNTKKQLLVILKLIPAFGSLVYTVSFRLARATKKQRLAGGIAQHGSNPTPSYSQEKKGAREGG